MIAKDNCFLGNYLQCARKLGVQTAHSSKIVKGKYQEGCIRHQQLPFLGQENLGFEDSVGFM